MSRPDAGFVAAGRAVRDCLQILRERTGPEAEGRVLSLTGARKSVAHLQASSELLELSRAHQGVRRTRLSLGAFDAAWMGWNAVYARAPGLADGGDRSGHLEIAVRAGAVHDAFHEALHAAVHDFGAALARPVSKGRSDDGERERHPVAHWIAESGKGATAGYRVGLAKKRLERAAVATEPKSLSKSLECAVSGLYELRCRRLHGDLVATTAGSARATERLCLAAVTLTARVVAARAIAGPETKTTARSRSRTASRRPYPDSPQS